MKLKIAEERAIQFTVYLNGIGATIEEAWEDAGEGFMLDPGSPPDEESDIRFLRGNK